MEGRGARRIDLSAKPQAHQLRGLRLPETGDDHAPDQPQSLQVGEQIDQLGGGGGFLGPQGQHDEHGQRGLGSNQVAQHAEAVSVRPLDIVQEESDRPLQRHGSKGQGGLIQDPKHPLIGQEPRQGRIPPGQCLPRVLVCLARERPRIVVNRGVGEDPAGHDERAPDLFVCRDVHGDEAGDRRRLGAGQQEVALADSRLALEADREDPMTGLLQGRLDRFQLCGAPNHGLGGPAGDRGRGQGLAGRRIGRHGVTSGAAGGEWSYVAGSFSLQAIAARGFGRVETVIETPPLGSLHRHDR